MIKQAKANILFINSRPVNPQLGGVERVTYILAKELIKRGYNVYHLHYANHSLCKGNFSIPDYSLPVENAKSKNSIEFLNAFLAEKEIDLFVVQSAAYKDSRLFFKIAISNNIKVVSVLHSDPQLEYPYLFKSYCALKKNTITGYLKLISRIVQYPKVKVRFWKKLKGQTKFIFHYSDRVCLLSEKLTPRLKTVYSGDLSKLISIPNPNTFNKDVDAAYFKKKQLLFVGRLENAAKRPDRLIMVWERIYQKYPDWELILLGDGPMLPQLIKQAQKLPRITFAGIQSPESYYEEASILCMTSNFEGFPMVLLEAMAHKLVPVAFNSFAAVTDVIQNEKNGMLVKPFLIEEYAEKISELIENEELRNAMARQAAIDVQKYNKEYIVDKWEKLFLELSS